MKDTYCEYCNPPCSLFRTDVTGYTNTEITVRTDFEEIPPQLAINVFHRGTNTDTLIYDGHFSININYCPKCGRKLTR